MRIGIVSKEYFGFKNKSSTKPMNAHGGFGYLTRKKAEEFVKRGHHVEVFVPRFSFDGESKKNLDIVQNGVNIHFFKTLYNIFLENSIFQKARRALSLVHLDHGSNSVFADFPVDIYLAEDPFQPSTRITKQGHPHIGIFQDPFDDVDYETMKIAESDYLHGDVASPRFVTEYMLRNNNSGKVDFYSSGRILNATLGKYARLSDQGTLFAEATFISTKLQKIFSLGFEPQPLRNPTDIGYAHPAKTDAPSIVWLARWDPQKRPDIALKVATQIPEAQFYFIGTASGHPALEAKQKELRNMYKKYENIHVLDFVSEEKKQEIIGSSWILLNTSVREGLPISFLEAGASGCAIVSSVDPDNYASSFGVFVKNADFVSAIRGIIKDESCFELGNKARKHMEKFHGTDVVMQKHVEALNQVLNREKTERLEPYEAKG